MVDSLSILVNKNEMSKNSENSFYSYDYHQPDGYRFSLDSVFLAQRVSAFLSSQYAPDAISGLKTMDLCAGCGVIGMELFFHQKTIKTIDFVEVQSLYEEYFARNVKMIGAKDRDFKLHLMNYSELTHNVSFHEQYDLVLSNPPYFFPGEGLLSPNDFKNRCRFFIDSDFEQLCSAIHYVLKPEGNAFVLVRPGKHHGRDLFKEWQNLILKKKWNLTAEIFDEVRGTNIVRLTKKA